MDGRGDFFEMIFVTGATGLTGKYLLQLFDRDAELENKNIVLFVRKTSDLSGLMDKGYFIEYGDITDKASLQNAMAGKEIDTLIHIVQLRYAPTIVDLANQFNVKRLIIIGTTGMFSKYQTYSEEYIKAESYIKKHSKVPYVILRPTMIYGDSKDRNMNKLLRFMNKYRFFPIFGSGKGMMQPIYYKDLATAIYDVYKHRDLSNVAFNLAGKEPLTYKQLLQKAGKALGKKVYVVRIPYFIAFSLIGFYNLLSPKPKIKLEQIRRLNEDKVFDYSEAKRAFNFDPIDFDTGIQFQVRDMKVEGHL